MSDTDTINDALANHAGFGTSYASAGATNQALIDTWRKSGMRQVYAPPMLQGEKSPHEWSFLKPVRPIDTTAPVTPAGTIAIVAGVVTLTGTTWPTWAADGDLVVDSKTYMVSSRDSTTQLTLNDTSINVTAGATCVLIRPAITMETGFAGLVGPITYRPGESSLYPALQEVGEFQVRQRRSLMDNRARPRMCALRNKTAGGAWQLVFYPVPDAVYGLLARIRFNPGDALFGGDDFLELFLESCLSIAESRLDDAESVHKERFMRLLQAAVTIDRDQFSPEFLGVDRDRSEPLHPYYGNRLGQGYRPYDNDDLVTYTGYTLTHD